MAKGPKAMNPADKARKEARKKEIKKNKKQRQQVRSAVIEGKDPEQILADLESLDKLEFNLTDIDSEDRQTGGNTDILFKEKRKRLKELWARVLAYYEKEDAKRHASLKKLESAYEASHKQAEREFEAIKAAQSATVDDVILPPEPDLPASLDDEIPDDDPLMSDSIYVTLDPNKNNSVRPPGCPPGPPPDFKQLVDSLRNSFSAPSIFIAQTIPQSLFFKANKKLAAQDNRKSRYRQRNDAPAKQTGDGSFRQSSSSEAATKHSDIKSQSAEEAKSAVIESKPVMFLQKATKFVPSSVRSKVSKPNKLD